MSKMTVNEAMVLMKAVRGRYTELSHLRATSANRETYYGETKKTIEPLYDLKKLDKKCVELENFLREIEAKIKQSNALVTVEMEADVKQLLSPLE